MFQDAVASGINNPTLETLDEEALLWNVEISELVVVSLGTGLESLALFRNNPDNEEAATMLQEKVGKKIAIPMDRFEQISKQLSSVANDTEHTHLEAEMCFSRW